MLKAIAINGSPRMEKGNTTLILNALIKGMADHGAEIETLYASQFHLKPCACGMLYCWEEVPGECCIKDEMQMLYPKIKMAEILILATPVYIPLPGDMQNFINRLCPLIDPVLVNRQGRTRARFREDVQIKKILLVCTSGWWEVENMGTVVRIVQELAEVASVEYAGALLRPHAYAMKSHGKITRAGTSVLKAAEKAGNELMKYGWMNQETLRDISRPLVAEADYL